MKKIFFFIVIIFLLFVFDTNILGDTTFNTYEKYFNTHNIKIISNKNTLNQNKYHNKIFSDYVKETDNYVAYNKNELVNIYFTAINNGYSNLTFYCDNSYIDCLKDINDLNSDDNDFLYVNELVNTYNSYSSIESTYSSNNRVDIKIDRKYTDEDINKIDNEINNIVNKLDINNYNDIFTKIKLFHDYIIDTNIYDNDMASTGESSYHSDTAIGTLFEGNSICSGYTDTMSIFLDKLNIDNIRVSTEKHVWNALYIDGKWYHLDLTWDDPVTSDGSNIISYEYYMLSTDELLNKDDNEHNFNKEVYNFLN